jgi:hypothetical protein
MNITMTPTIDYRPCIVEEHKALFHMWSQRCTPVGGTLQYTIGIVEYEDGTVHECYPNVIRFCDNKCKDYTFPEEKKEIKECRISDWNTVRFNHPYDIVDFIRGQLTKAGIDPDKPLERIDDVVNNLTIYRQEV